MKMLGSREGMSDAPPRESGGGAGGGGNRPAAAPQPAGTSFNDFEDDIPF
jgi:single-strand DNA-binding protein